MNVHVCSLGNTAEKGESCYNLDIRGSFDIKESSDNSIKRQSVIKTLVESSYKIPNHFNERTISHAGHRVESMRGCRQGSVYNVLFIGKKFNSSLFGFETICLNMSHTYADNTGRNVGKLS